MDHDVHSLLEKSTISLLLESCFFGKLTITRSVLVLKSRKTTMFHALNYKTIILLVQIPIVLVAEPSCCASVVPQKTAPRGRRRCS